MSENTKPVCVIEDNTPIRKLLTTILERSGFSTVSFADGTSAIDWIKQNEAVIILVDFVLPDLDGGAIVDFIRKMPNGNNVPVIAVTGLAQEHDKERIMKMGFDSYISKPIQTATFAKTVQEIIDKKNS